MAKKKPTPKKKIASKKKSASNKKSAPNKKTAPTKRFPVRSRGSSARTKEGITRPVVIRGRRGLGSESGGQSGDTQGLSRREVAESESVEELTEEGQDLEAEIVSGVENALDPDEAEVTTSEVPEDDVPEEYTDSDK